MPIEDVLRYRARDGGDGESGARIVKVGEEIEIVDWGDEEDG